MSTSRSGSHLMLPSQLLMAAASPSSADLLALRDTEDLKRVPQPMHRHAAPSAPWPWVDLDDHVAQGQLEGDHAPIPPICDHGEDCDDCWKGYPKSRFPNWTDRQVDKSKIGRAIRFPTTGDCTIYGIDVDNNGYFKNGKTVTVKQREEAEFWNDLVREERPGNLRVRALFIDNMSGPVLQMFGAKYNIEPFFWSSSLNWIPSRFQEEMKPGVGDHITVTLTFLKSMTYAEDKTDEALERGSFRDTLKIDTQAPLFLHSNKRKLVLDLLALHLIRNVNGSTLISFHPKMKLPTTSAKFLHERMRFAGQSVYWQNIFQASPDPTFILLAFIWHAVYAWDEALENLYAHICFLETAVISTTEMSLTQELHAIRAHHLHYTSLLDDFAKHIEFIRKTPNPLLDNLSKGERTSSENIMNRECDNLLAEIQRLGKELRMQERRLKNVIGLVFSSVNITDSRHMRRMTEAAVRDSAAMKQVAYLTMVFLPASFVAGVFGMNVREINPDSLGTLAHYIEVALPLTLLTAWILVAFQGTFPPNTHPLKRLLWPIIMVQNRLATKQKSQTIDLPYLSHFQPKEGIKEVHDHIDADSKADDYHFEISSPTSIYK